MMCLFVYVVISLFVIFAFRLFLCYSCVCVCVCFLLFLFRLVVGFLVRLVSFVFFACQVHLPSKRSMHLCALSACTEDSGCEVF